MRSISHSPPVLRAALAGLLLAAGACSDSTLPAGPAQAAPLAPPSDNVGAFDCTASIAAHSVSCGPTTPQGVHASILGGQNVNLKLTSSNITYDSVAQVFAADVTVQNLLIQRMGTASGTDTAGVAVFFSSAPKATSGTGSVTVNNADGIDVFTGVNQPYFMYRQILPYMAVSAVKRWKWNVPKTVGTFGFRVYVSTEILPAIVFDRVNGAQVDIFRAGIDGSDLTALTSNAADDEDPTTAMGKVVFTSWRDSTAELYSMPLAGGTQTRLTFTKALDTEPALSPDGTRIAFINDVSGVGKVWTAAADGTGAARATTGFSFAGAIEVAPTWLSNTGLVFVSTAAGTADLYTMTLGGTPAVLEQTSKADIQPAASPDGSQVAFVSNRSGDTEIWVRNMSTGVAVNVSKRTGSDAEPTWLPDGRIVFTEYVGSTPHLAWVDPSFPGVLHDIPTGTGTPRRAAGILY
ncbi:MAG TPA: hypothetical protein VFH27_07960 [Longimicrobiaceae bacterium]|nr:hypothetical protein [Longimicrobiaceae bacterium]